MTNVLFAAPDKDWAEYEQVLPEAISAAGIDANIIRLHDTFDPSEIDYIVYAPTSPVKDFTPFTNCKAVLNLWAGVEAIIGNETLTQPLTRMVDFGLTEGMVEWCVGHTLRHHLGMDADIKRTDTTWDFRSPPLARDRKVTVLGLGELGRAVATALRRLNFDVIGWSRTPKALKKVRCLSGEAGLRVALESAEILILLLPLTGETENILNAENLAQLPEGAVVINPGRGPLIDDDALLAALNSGRVGHATLDVFRVEPLPSDHPYWAHPNVTVTPHLASDTRAPSAATVVAENIRRSEAGEPLLHLVDRAAGY
ncbi:MAG: glyoxylate/hydroxypyruvate reductase A [Boseongicola sp.]|nr:glyoxylate/hydroxypyruvate reductase A [Boseongicola sp.]